MQQNLSTESLSTSAKAENALRALPVEQGPQHRCSIGSSPHRIVTEASVQDPERRAVATSRDVVREWLV